MACAHIVMSHARTFEISSDGKIVFQSVISETSKWLHHRGVYRETASKSIYACAQDICGSMCTFCESSERGGDKPEHSSHVFLARLFIVQIEVLHAQDLSTRHRR